MNLFRSRIRVAGAVFALMLVAASCGGDAEVAEVADESLTQDEMTALLDDPSFQAANVGDESLTGDALADLLDGAPEGTVEKQDAAAAITSWVRNELWYAELAERDFAVTDAHFAAARLDLENIALTDPSVPDLDTAFGAEVIRSQALPVIVAEYLIDVLKVELAWPEQLCSSHILVETEAEADAVITRLVAGEDFGSLATELSIDTGTIAGDLGCVDPATFVSEFVDGARLVEAPGLSAPVQSDFGWHVIDVRSLDATPSEDPVVIQNSAFSSPEFLTLQEAVLARPVTIDPRYGTWDNETFSVAPADG